MKRAVRGSWRNVVDRASVFMQVRCFWLVLTLAAVLAGCGNPQPTPSQPNATIRLPTTPPTPSPSPSASPAPSPSLTLDCGPLAGDAAACAVAVAAGKLGLLNPNAVVTAVRIQRLAPGATCPPNAGCPIRGLVPDLVATFASNDGDVAVALIRTSSGGWMAAIFVK